MLSGLTFGNKKDLEKEFKAEADREKARKREEKKQRKKEKKVSAACHHLSACCMLHALAVCLY
jgi:hypothetical protein